LLYSVQFYQPEDEAWKQNIKVCPRDENFRIYVTLGNDSRSPSREIEYWLTEGFEIQMRQEWSERDFTCGEYMLSKKCGTWAEISTDSCDWKVESGDGIHITFQTG
jgi:hypothetical protein